MKLLNMTVFKKIYSKIFRRHHDAKMEMFLKTCKKVGIFSPLLKSSCRELLVPHPLTVQQFAQHLEVGETVLDMGCGTGILTKLAFKKGAEKVVAVDINPAAVQHTKRLVPQAEVILSDLFENVEGIYDTIIFNCPWAEGDIHNPSDYAIYDSGNVVERFLKDSKRYLTKGGHIWIQYADAFPKKYNKLHELLKENALKIEKQWYHERWGPLVNREIKVFLYRISPDRK